MNKEALGKIYRTVKEGLQITTNLEDMVDDCVDESLVLPGSEQYLDDDHLYEAMKKASAWHQVAHGKKYRN